MENKDKNERTEKAKEAFSNIWQKTSSAGKNVGKKAAEGVKAFADQTKKNIYDAQAKKYIIVTESEIASEEFVVPTVIKIVDDSANRNFVTCDDAIGWIEKHEDISVLHIYLDFAKKGVFQFVPALKKDSVYCEYKFGVNKFVDINDIFKRANDDKVAELEKMAFDLGAKSCSIEIVESDTTSKESSVGIKIGSSEASIGFDGSSSKKSRNVIRGKTTVRWGGSDTPIMPRLNWFEHSESIKNLIDMRFGDRNAIKSKSYELSGLSSVTMNKNVAGVIDNILGLKGNASMGSKVSREQNSILIFEIEF